MSTSAANPLPAYRLTLEWLPGRYAVCRLDPHATLPAWVLEPDEDRPACLLSITRTERELSIVIEESRMPAELVQPRTPIQRGFRALRIVGTLDFSLVGILANITTALASAGIPVFVLSTFDTDIILVREADAQRAGQHLGAIADIRPQP